MTSKKEFEQFLKRRQTDKRELHKDVKKIHMEDVVGKLL